MQSRLTSFHIHELYTDIKWSLCGWYHSYIVPSKIHIRWLYSSCIWNFTCIHSFFYNLTPAGFQKGYTNQNDCLPNGDLDVYFHKYFNFWKPFLKMHVYATQEVWRQLCDYMYHKCLSKNTIHASLWILLRQSFNSERTLRYRDKCLPQMLHARQN